MRGQLLSPELISSFLDYLTEMEKRPETVSSYRRSLMRLYEFLPEDKMILPGTLKEWRSNLDSQQLSGASVYLYCAAANSYVRWCGRWDLRISMKGPEDAVRPELTRNEYLRLLSAAQRTGKDRAYMLVKTFGTLGLSVRELPYLTVEAVKKGRVTLPQQKEIRIPECFRRELLEYADSQSLPSGMIFQSASGKSLDRTNVWDYINGLAKEARVDEAKCNPRCLSRLCQKTREDIRRNIEVLENQMYEHLLEDEQNIIGWENAG